MLRVKDLRTSFTDYFSGKGHKIVPSSSLLPKDDPTLLFTTAGMVQFKPMFAGTVELEYTRAATIQKCLRTSDLENVGRTKRHLTFFEMLGNFSFGDYFKKEAIEYAWEFSRDLIGFPEKNIWISIYLDDDEAFELWNKRIGIPAERIVRLGKEDNFWGPAGDTGACGPCSELYLDRGEEYGCGSPDCKPGCDCERFLEYWNLVFNQFNQNEKGELIPLPRTGIDTGMGLERLATLVQNVDSVYQTDEFASLTDFVTKERAIKYNEDTKIPVNIIVEHARALTFAISDGIFPSNEGRGYVLRRILRRALRYSRQLGIAEPFVYKLVNPLVEIMGDFYPEIKDTKNNVINVIKGEEKRFLETIEKGMSRLEELIEDSIKKGSRTINGEEAFVLYDTFGFPLEMTLEIAQERDVQVDNSGFEAEMERQRERGKQSWKGEEAGYDRIFKEMAQQTGDSVFTGYTENQTQTKIEMLASSKGSIDKTGPSSDEVFLVLKETPFYGESGGQIGDKGLITTNNGAIFDVTDTKKYDKTIIHIGRITAGEISKGENVNAKIDSLNRNLIRANHTVTHLLHAALRKVLGEHVKQAGSLVEAERMRFDFSHFSPMTQEEISKVENMVNQKIWENLSVNTEEMDLEKAVNSGAMAVFDEKYDTRVRVVSIDDYSMELCGGTHVDNTGKIGAFRILKESSPGAGIRRIEAVTLKGVLEKLRDQETIVKSLSEKINVPESGLIKKIEDVLERNRLLEKELEKIKKSQLSSGIDDYIKNARNVEGIKIINAVLKNASVEDMRNLADAIRSKEQGCVVLLGSSLDAKPVLLFAATSKAVEKGIDCGKLIKETAPLISGGGGGKKDMAQAGGKNSDSLEQAITLAANKSAEMIK